MRIFREVQLFVVNIGARKISIEFGGKEEQEPRYLWTRDAIGKTINPAHLIHFWAGFFPPLLFRPSGLVWIFFSSFSSSVLSRESRSSRLSALFPLAPRITQVIRQIRRRVFLDSPRGFEIFLLLFRLPGPHAREGRVSGWGVR